MISLHLEGNSKLSIISLKSSRSTLSSCRVPFPDPALHRSAKNLRADEIYSHQSEHNIPGILECFTFYLCLLLPRIMRSAWLDILQYTYTNKLHCLGTITSLSIRGARVNWINTIRPFSCVRCIFYPPSLATRSVNTRRGNSSVTEQLRFFLGAFDFWQLISRIASFLHYCRTRRLIKRTRILKKKIDYLRSTWWRKAISTRPLAQCDSVSNNGSFPE